MDRIALGQTRDGNHTDVWLDGLYSRIDGHLSSNIAFAMVRQARAQMARVVYPRT